MARGPPFDGTANAAAVTARTVADFALGLEGIEGIEAVSAIALAQSLAANVGAGATIASDTAREAFATFGGCANIGRRRTMVPIDDRWSVSRR